MKKYVLIAIALLVSLLLWFVFIADRAEAPSSESMNETSTEKPDSSDSQSYTVEEPEIAEAAYSIDELDSLWLIVNKTRPIDLGYVPDGLRDVNVVKREDKSASELQLRDEAATALEAMFADAKKESIDLLMGSAYRSADLQATYYNSYVATYGQAEADKFSARPGTSEHQTGLSVDVAPVSRNCYLEICFADTPEGMWVAEHAHEYGFIIRYPNDKTDITGYQFEPWHLRFVDTELAGELYRTGQTLEEYFNLVP